MATKTIPNADRADRFEFEPTIVSGDCTTWLRGLDIDLEFDLTFLDPPFNQGKEYENHDDRMPDDAYWDWMRDICALTRKYSSPGAAIYFMQREKNTESVLRVIRESGWTFQNLIIWRKKTSAVPGMIRYGKAFQVIVFATNGPRPRVFNRLRIDPPLPQGYSARENGVFVTDVWDDIRELTAGYFAGDEPLKDAAGERAHKQQPPLALLLRIILSSTMPEDLVFDPFAGTGTTLSAAQQLERRAIGIEKSPKNVAAIRSRLAGVRAADDLSKYRQDYWPTQGLAEIWPGAEEAQLSSDVARLCEADYSVTSG